MTRCAITCAEVGCNNKIYYEDTDDEVSLYCCRHVTDDGRHAAVRILHPKPVIKEPEPEPPKPVKKVVLRCAACKIRETVTEDFWKKSKQPLHCKGCGGILVYHKDA